MMLLFVLIPSLILTSDLPGKCPVLAQRSYLDTSRMQLTLPRYTDFILLAELVVCKC